MGAQNGQATAWKREPTLALHLRTPTMGPTATWLGFLRAGRFSACCFASQNFKSLSLKCDQQPLPCKAVLRVPMGPPCDNIMCMARPNASERLLLLLGDLRCLLEVTSWLTGTSFPTAHRGGGKSFRVTDSGRQPGEKVTWPGETAVVGWDLNPGLSEAKGGAFPPTLPPTLALHEPQGKVLCCLIEVPGTSTRLA